MAFAVNAVIDYLLLAASARLGGAPLRRGRLLLAAGLGGVFAALSLALPPLRLWPMKILTLAGMLAVAFGLNRGLLRQGALFGLVCLALAGLTLAVASAFDAPLVVLNGTACYPLSFPALVMTAGAAYLAADFFLRRAAQHGGGEIVPVVIESGGRQASLTALRDTGNTLCDPVDNSRVMVVQWQALKPLLPERFCQSWCADPTRFFETLTRLSPRLHWRLIGYRAVGTQGMLLGFKADRATIDGKAAGRVTVALSPTPVSDGGGYMGLIGGNI